MKNIIIAIVTIIMFYLAIGNVSSYVIPEDALRVRVIANSDSEYDQEVKLKVKEDLQIELYELLNKAKDVTEAREIINANLDKLDLLVNTSLQNQNYLLPYEINFGLNYFPAKEYKGTIYEEGYYESLVVTLGSGEGDNWWCVLFPPLCLLEASESDDIEYTSFVKELMDKYL